MLKSVEIMTGERCYSAKIDVATASYLYTQVVAKEPDKFLEITDAVEGAYIAVRADSVESIIIMEAE